MKISRNEAKKTDFLARLRRFFDYALLHPLSYALVFRQMKSFIKMHCRGEFY